MRGGELWGYNIGRDDSENEENVQKHRRISWYWFVELKVEKGNQHLLSIISH